MNRRTGQSVDIFLLKRSFEHDLYRHFLSLMFFFLSIFFYISYSAQLSLFTLSMFVFWYRIYIYTHKASFTTVFSLQICWINYYPLRLICIKKKKTYMWAIKDFLKISTCSFFFYMCSVIAHNF